MLVDLAWLAAVALSLPALADCDPLFVMSAPNLLRVGTPEKVFVEAQDYTGGEMNIKISVKDYPRKSRELVSESVTLKSGNSFMSLASITIPEGRDYFDENPTENQYVYLLAQFPGHLLEKVVLVSFQSGFIFVQTDKTIYTPSSTVMYRVFSLSPVLEPVQSGISVEIMTPDNIIISKEVIYPNGGMKSGEHKLPEIVSFGTWKLVTRFQSTPQKNFTTEFEVKEYVLPSFEVSLSTEKAFFYVDDKELTIDINARYLYGKDVSGVAFVTFGVQTTDNTKKLLPAALQRVVVKDGKAKGVLKKEHIQETFKNVYDLVHSSFYVSVSVLTETGSEMVEAKKGGIMIVTSPYTVHFKRTPKYFKPGMPFDVTVFVSNPDGTPANKISVEVSSDGKTVMGTTKENGLAKVTINSKDGASNLPISVKTKDPLLTDERQARQQMTAEAYQATGSKSYLHIGVDAAELAIDDQLKFNLNMGNKADTQNHDLTYLILNKGQLVRGERFKRQGQSLVTLSLPVTKDMVPSFRIIAYYHTGSTEVVSDSVWVDVKDTCLGTLKVEVVNPKPVYEPRKPFSLSITGDPGARVGLVAVDKGVYVLNNKHRLTQSKIWDVIEKHDTGCTAGSGKNSMGVFFDAGLVFQSQSAGGTDFRTSATCPSPAKRRRRSITIMDFRNTLAEKYQGLEKECCTDGMTDNIMGLTCERRSEYITEEDKCVKAFLHCCKEMANKKVEAKELILMHARSDDDDDAYISSDEIVSRSQFPESWLWEEELLQCPAGKSCTSTSFIKKSFLKDSITSWQITAISLSKTHGLCVADPLEMVVVKNFFVDLKLPYSVVRNEQVEIKAVLYNYENQEITVRVELMETEDICSAATKRSKHRVTVNMDPMTSRAVPFIIIPMELGKHSIEVKAAVFDSHLTDGVKKDLNVVAEGVLTKIEVKNVALKPSEHNGQQVEEVISTIPKRQVPGTPATTQISITAEQISQTIEKAISGDSMASLIVQPRGCGEQNMIYMTLPTIATHYLDNTNQWDQVGLEKRETAKKFIKMGYEQQQAFRKPDGSFSVWADKPSSSWLTAYVAKVFAMASDIISIQDDVICSTLKWLVLNAQQPDGTFKETFTVYHGEMVGDVKGKDSDASMTAFVLIAMQEGQKICAETVASLPGSMTKATQYLEGRLKSLTNPYAVAMVSYALANAGKLNKEILFQYSKAGEGTHWPVAGNHLFTLEATAYALLALVRAKEFDKAGAVVHWLNRQQKHSGGYGSTQTTIMVFQAVAEYRTYVKQVQDTNLEVDVMVSGRTKSVKWTFNRANAFLTRSDKISLNQNLTITASGTGEGALSVMTLYYAVPSDKDMECKNFDLKVTLEKQNKVTMQGALATYLLTIDTRFLSTTQDATMSILDIGLLTGFTVDNKDLTDLTSGKDRYIQKFEMDKLLSDRGSLIIYLNTVSRTRPDRVAFRIHQVMEVGLLQPAGVTVYEYLAMENRCVKFYHTEKRDGNLNRICTDDFCKCAEESCSVQKKQNLNENDKEKMKVEREDKACEAGMDYVYKVTVEKADLTSHTDVYHMKVNTVIKEGTDFGVEGQTRMFVGHPYCRNALGLQVGKSFLVMGQSQDVIRVGNSLQYLMGHQTWIEYWPTQAEGQTPAFRDQYSSIEELAHNINNFGCST
ncbi:complement C3-like [Denticeps clupeoides]|uniref:Complement C3 n=1 Tax=Denticeps clupeoides TaxID=299321 RepID=A0AAY4A478_9TELE|nr:complement C3-like [Denticeps clupeoides]